MNGRAGRLEIQVVAPILGSFDHCDHCQIFLNAAGVGQQIHQEDLASYPEEVWQEFQALSDWVLHTAKEYGDRILIRLIDPRTPGGLWFSLRHWIRRYPTFLIGDRKIVGLRYRELREAIEGALRTPKGGG